MGKKTMQERTEGASSNQRMKDKATEFCYAKPRMHAREGSTFLLSGWGGPSSFPSGLRGTGNLDSP